jgi:hypothetical protein
MAGSTAVTPGQVNFCDASAPYCTDIHLLGTAQLTSHGTAVLKFVPGIGTHSYKAVFLGTSTDKSSSSQSSSINVTGSSSFPAVTAIAPSGSAGNYTLTASVSGGNALLPSGNVSFLDTSNANYVLGTAALGSEKGAPTFGLIKSSSPSTNQYPQAVAVADFNGDGKLDLAMPVYVIGDPLGVVSVLLGNGVGTFTAAPQISLTGTNAGSIVVGDFNNDGKPDMAITLPDNNEVAVFLGKGDGTFTQAATISDPDGPFFVTAADFNGDGIEDLAVVNPASLNLTIYLGNGDGTFTLKSSPPAGSGLDPLAATVADFNGDGKLDIAVADYARNTGVPGSVTILLGNGDGTFTQAAATPPTGDSPVSITAADFNGDGKMDLAVANSYDDVSQPGSITILLGKGDGTFTPAAASPATGYIPGSVAFGDFNGDGKVDLVAPGSVVLGSSTAPGNATVLLGNGDGTFTSAVTPTTGVTPIFTAVGDFNGDGLDDLATANNFSSTVTVDLSQITETSTATINGVSIVGTGSHQVDASYSGDTNYAAALSTPISLTAQPVSTALSLTPNPGASNYGQQVSLIATLSPSSAQAQNATGTVTFSSGTTTLGTASLAGGTATLNLTSLSAGTDSITASYPGDTNFAASSSTATVTVVAPDFSVGLSPTSLSVKQGSSATTALSITPAGGFSQSLQLSCSGLPANSTCTFSPGSVTPAGAAVNSTLTITTNVQSAALIVPGIPSRNFFGALLGPATFACIFGFLGIRRKRWAAFARASLAFSAIVLCIAISACGGGSVNSSSQGSSSTTTTPGPVTPAGTSTITVTASTAGSSGTIHSTNLTVTVTN